MEQRISFCTTSDGVGIAYAVIGEGQPLVYVNGWPGHLEVEWERPFSRAFLEALAAGVTLVRYDMRGSGLSDREVSGFSLDDLTKDLAAVIDDLGLDHLTLLGLGFLAGPIALTYAAAHPERVTSLVLSSGYVRGGEITDEKRRNAMLDYVASFGLPDTIGTDDVSEIDKWLDVYRIRKVASSHHVQAALLRTMFDADVTDLAKRLDIPALILHGRGDSVMPFTQGRELATLLQRATFVPFEASSAAPWAQQQTIIGEMRRFLGIEEAAAAATPAAGDSAGDTITILFTDIESSTALTQRLGDEQAQQLVRAHNDIVRAALASHAGSEIKHTGDGIMASFQSASRALECAIAIQRAVALRQAQGGQAEPVEAALRVRIGLNAGEPVAEEEDLFGTAVQLARRVCDQAEAGEILASNVVRELAAGKGFLFSDQGETALRGFEDPVRIYEVRWQET